MFEEALRSIATKLGERVGPTFNLAQPRVTSYLNAVMMIKYPKMSVTMQRELRTIAESLDEIAVGGVAESADLLIQRFKAIEESLKCGGSWRLSRHLEVTKDIDSLVSTEEQLAAAKEELSRLKLTDGKK